MDTASEKLDGYLYGFLRTDEMRKLSKSILLLLLKHGKIRTKDLKSELLLNEDLVYSTQLFRVLGYLEGAKIIQKTQGDRIPNTRGKPPTHYQISPEFATIDDVDLMTVEEMRAEIRKLRPFFSM
jgi:hypothetical protein